MNSVLTVPKGDGDLRRKRRRRRVKRSRRRRDIAS